MKQVVIVGRPNVGKSALFNRLAGRKISIVHDQPGVTRDRITAVCRLGGRAFEVIDTGGIGFAADPDFAVVTREAAEVAIAGADVLLFVVDSKDGLTPLDCDLADQIRESGKPIVLVVNKVDDERWEDAAVGEFSSLGLERVVVVSAAHGRGFEELVEVVGDLLGEDFGVGDEQEAPRIAIVGRPNAGKSSLLNAMIGEHRVIVSERAGTTRDAVDTVCEYGGQRWILVDTAGIRHRSRHNSSVEVFSVMRSESAIRRADLCVLVVDISQGVTAQDKRIAGLIQRAGKACVVALNKWDLLVRDACNDDARVLREERLEEARSGLFFLPYAPMVVLSAKSGMSVKRLFTEIDKVRQHARRRMGTGELNRVLRAAMEQQPPPLRGGKRFKLLYATQVTGEDPRPFDPPIVLLFVNDPKLLPLSYLNYLAGRLRQRWEYPGLPLHVRLRGRQRAAVG